MTYKVDIFDVGFDSRGNRSVSIRSPKYFLRRESAERFMNDHPQPKGYHGVGCACEFKITELEFEDAGTR